MKWVIFIGIIILIPTMVTGCAAGPNQLVKVADEGGKVAGFWSGLWHGLIFPITFMREVLPPTRRVVSLFKDTVTVYEVHNNGNWYHFGFLLGIASTFGGGGKASG